MARKDEDRPPIIVRGGSLILECGDAERGKPWKKHSDREFRPDQPNGKDVSTLSVRYIGGGAGCRPIHAPAVRITYELDDKDRTTVQVAIGKEEATGDRKKREPVVRSTKPLEIDAKDARLLVFKGEGRILRVEAGGQVCSEPVQAIVEFVPPKSSGIKWWLAGIAGAVAALAFWKRATADRGETTEEK